MKLFKNKKAVAFLIIGIAFFLTALAILFAESNINHDDYVGTHQYQILQLNEKIKTIQTYINLASKYTGIKALNNLFTHSGFYTEYSDAGEKTTYPCGEYQYPIYFKGDICVPDYEESLKTYFNEIELNYLKNYNDSIIFDYDLSIHQKGNDLRILAEAKNPLKKYLNNLNSLNVFLEDTGLGTFGDEKIINCDSGQCLADIAKKYTQTYSQDKSITNYVFGGFSPYPPADTARLAKQKNSFFYGTNPSVEDPGFDCSGWVWWVAKHAGLKEFKNRLTANDYYVKAKKVAKKICSHDSNKCLRQEIIDEAEPGDILFYGTPDKITHIMIYVGNGQISHSRASKGLVIENLPSFYASNTKTSIMGVYRFPYNQKSQNNSTEKITADYSSSNIIQPTFNCNENDGLPSNTYLKRIKETAWNSQGMTYQDIAIKSALDKGLDPAIIVTHMVLESSLGKNNRCLDQGKSHLTGCAWFNSCSKDCACDSSYVKSDYAQGTCTAKTDKNAYLEAVTGTKQSNGYYTKCNKYKNDPKKQWNCILCTYQGNYDSALKGKKYFTKDGTCEYAERFKKTYCQWKNYFQNEGLNISYDLNASRLSALSNSYIEYTPYIDTTIKLNLKELSEIKTFVNETASTCKDNLKVCLKNEINNFNNVHKVQIQMNSENDSLARDLVDQLNDCYLNGQSKCICPLKINTNLSARGFEKIFLRINKLKKVFTGESSWIDYSSGTLKNILDMDFKLGFKIGDEPIQEKDYIDFIIDKTNLKDSRYEIASFGRDKQFDLFTKPPRTTIGLMKESRFSMYWTNYTSINPSMECRDNKNNFRLQAKLTFTNKTMDFSINLEDIKAPHILLGSVQQSNMNCLNNPAIKITWHTNTDTDKPYDFFINFNNQKNSFRFIESASEQNTGNNLFRLQKKPFTKNANEYSVVIDKLPDNTLLRINQTYTIYLTVRDHYLNKEDETIGSIKIIDLSDSNNTLNLNTNTQLVNGLINILSGENSSCGSDQVEVVQLNGKKITPINFLKPQNTNQGNNSSNISLIIPPTQSLNLVPYDGLFDPLNHEQLYWITGIPNVVCEESTSKITQGTNLKGKYCASTAQMIGKLKELSETVLVPKKYRLVITQAFRPHELQLFLWDHFNHNSSKVCNPTNHLCPHEIAGALDLNIFNLNSYTSIEPLRLSQQEEESIMCDAGFVRYHGERWHYEYGTPQWSLAEEKRQNGDPVCAY